MENLPPFPDGTKPGDVVDLTPDAPTCLRRMMNSYGGPAREPGTRVGCILSYLRAADKAVSADRFRDRKREIAAMEEDGMIRSWEWKGRTWLKATPFGMALARREPIPDLRGKDGQK